MDSIQTSVEQISFVNEAAPEMTASKIASRLSKAAAVILNGEAHFNERISRWSASAEKTPQFVICPSTAEDVSQAVTFCAEEGAEFAVCCGGHSTSAISSTEGILISLDLMRGVSVDEEKKTVRVQGGARWSDVNVEAEKYGLAVVCGTVDHTGVGGLTLGGGYGMATGERGLVLDNILSVEIVLANGLVVEASKTRNSDLFWAIRGAGSKFGIVTSFVFQAFDQKEDVWGGLIVLSIDKLAAALDFGNKYFEKPDPKSTMLFAVGSMEEKIVITAFTYYNGSESEGRNFYQPLLDLDPIANTTKPRSYQGINHMLNEVFPTGLRRSMKGSAFIPPLGLEFVQRDIEALQQFLSETPDGAASAILYEYIGYDKIIAVPQNETAFANRGAYSNILYTSGWTEPEHDDACRLWARTRAANAKKEFQKLLSSGKFDPVTRVGVGEYFNYDGVGASGKVVFGSNYPRLCELKARYDPNNVFKKGPVLSLETNGVAHATGEKV